MKLIYFSPMTKISAAIYSSSYNGPGQVAPTILYSDALSGPTTGGEGGNGCYLSIFGYGFGDVSALGTTTKLRIGGVEVNNYRFLGQSKVYGKLPIQHMIVQVGSLGGAANGTSLPIQLTTSGGVSNNDITFTPVNARIFFVSLSGNDGTAAAGNINLPYRYLQRPDPNRNTSGLYPVLRAGDHVVIRGGDWNDTGFETAWLRFRDPNQMGSAPGAGSQTGWIHFTAYPGPNISTNAYEDVHYTTPASSKGGFQGPGSSYYGTTGEYISFSNLRMDCVATAASDAAPFNLQYGGGRWRVVNNEAGPWPSTLAAPGNSKGGGVAGHGDAVFVYGNHIHDMACVGALENHGIYIDSGASNWDVGYNYIHDITGGNLIQLYDNVGLAGNNYVGFPSGWQGFTGMQVHHNWMENCGKYGLNIAESNLSGKFWNNIVIGATYAGCRFSVAYPQAAYDISIVCNTFYDNDRLSSGSGNGQILNSAGNTPIGGSIRIWNNIFMGGPNTVSGSVPFDNNGNSVSYYSLSENIYYRATSNWSSVTSVTDAKAKFTNPQFTDATGRDFTIGSSSSAKNASTLSLPFSIVDDFYGVSRPQGVAIDIGASERVGG